MQHFFSLHRKVRARLGLLAAVLLVGLGLMPEKASASHIRAGDIQAKGDTTQNAPLGSRRVFFKMVLYTDIVGIGGQTPAKQPTATIFFGDGTSSCLDAVPRAGGERSIPGNTDSALNIYFFEHTYPSSGEFTVSFIGENRNGGVLNMDNSINQSFYISTTFTLDPALNINRFSPNRSPILTTPAIDKGATGQVFLHNPGGFDADGDSLSFKLQDSRKVALGVEGTLGAPCTLGNGAVATGNNRPLPVTVPNYRFPADPILTGGAAVQVPYAGVPVGRPGEAAIFVQDINTGQITWNAPSRAGIYNVAMVVEEWRRTPAGRRKIGEVIRDIQIIITNTANLRPIITIPEDICVIAGETVTGLVTAVDGVSPTSPQTPVTLFAFSGIIPPARFTQTATGPPTARGTFVWQTQCANVARLPYLVVFKAQDNPSPVTAANPPLIDEKTWRITVVGPPPQNLRAAPDASTGLNRSLLTWNTYTCANAQFIHIYRKENPSGFVPGPCETGIPASSGYVRIATVPASATSFTDNNTNAGGQNLGLERGKTYCYRIYADFPGPAFGASIASAEACASFVGRAAQLKNVDVEVTSATQGQIAVRWTQPRPAAGTVFDGTPSFVLSRAEGLAPTAFTPVRTFTSLNDTSFVDTGLNTLDRQYTYQLEFIRSFSNGSLPVREVAAPASSVRVTVVPNNPPTSFTVSWTYRVPWNNSLKPVVIYRRNGAAGSPYVQIATAPTTATGGTYQDRDPALVKGQTYCYYVRTEGQYAPTGYLSSLLNKSQEQCAALIAA
ncbi:hypothetical protein BEN47_19575, partial [Hymenobacter lapidarius]